MKTFLSIASNGKGNLGFRVRSGQFNIDFDVSELMRGNNSAPNPHTYFVASLLGCKAITAKMYAMRKGYPLEDVHIDMEVTSEQSQAENTPELFQMMLKVRLIGDLDEKQREEIHNAMQHCPIHRLMSDEVRIEINSELLGVGL